LENGTMHVTVTYDDGAAGKEKEQCHQHYLILMVRSAALV